MKEALFVRMPRHIASLKFPGRYALKRPYHIAAVVPLSPLDYENFSADLTVDRPFIRAYINHSFVDDKGLWHCLLVHEKKDAGNGILVMAEGQAYPKWAALYTINHIL